jgi:hypothetical protein
MVVGKNFSIGQESARHAKFIATHKQDIFGRYQNRCALFLSTGPRGEQHKKNKCSAYFLHGIVV